MGFLQQVCSAEELRQINVYIDGQPRFPGFRIPSFGLDKQRPCTATELANLFRLLPVALLLTSKSIQNVFLEPVQGGVTQLCLAVLDSPLTSYEMLKRGVCGGGRGGGGGGLTAVTCSESASGHFVCVPPGKLTIMLDSLAM